MSWSFYAMGKPAAVTAKAQHDLGNIKCAEPEESIKHKVLTIIENALRHMPDDSAVSIKASGSQSAAHGGDGKPIPGRMTNSVSLVIEPIWGFVE